MLPVLAWLSLVFATLWTLGGLAALTLATRRKTELAAKPRAVSVLKPLCGKDAELEQNLETFFEQDQPEFELVFGVVDARDTALAIVERVRALGRR